MRQAWAETGPEIAASLTPALLAHRDFVLAEHVGLPLDFLPDWAASRGTSASCMPRNPANGTGQRILERMFMSVISYQ
jgi:hypothetical protein